MKPVRSWVIGMRMCCAVLGLVLCAHAASVSAVPPEPEGVTLDVTPDYFYDATGRRPLDVSSTDFVVGLRPGAAPRGAAGVPVRPSDLPARVQPEDLHPAALEMESLLERREVYVVRQAELGDLQRRGDAEYVLPLLRRSGSDVPIYPNDRIIARFRAGTDPAAVIQLADSLGCDAVKLDRGEDRYLLTSRDVRTSNPIAVANYLHERDDLTEYAHPSFYLPKVTLAPPVINDPYYLSHQWHLDGDVLKGADPNSDINAETAWDSVHGMYAEGNPAVSVAVIDECVEKLHPDLFPNWWTGLDVDQIPYDDDPSPSSGQRHGTACAGLAVAKGNDIGVRGVAPNCGLIGIKFFGGDLADTAYAFLFCKDPNNDGDHSDGAAVLSNSWSYADGTLLPPDVVNAINDVATTGRNGKGSLILFAAGNNDHTVNGVSALAQLQNVMAIGGANSHAVHTEFSDVGPEIGIATPTNDRGDDGVRFPWLDITSVDNTGQSGYNGLPDLDYTNAFGGTSAATPIAAGVLALIISQDTMMTSAQARAIMQHTAVRIDEPYGRFDPITGHSHRFGFGRADIGAAIAAATAGKRWPDRIRSMSITPAGDNISVTWSTPPNNYAGSLLVRSDRPFAWAPTDGVTYNVSDVVAPGVQVVHNGSTSAYADLGATSGGFFYGVFPRSANNLYGFGAKGHIIRDGVTLLYDNSEVPDPGWTHGGVGDEWTRGTPTSAVSIFGQSVSGSGPLAGLRGTRAINGNRCWGTDMSSRYNANVNAYLETPLLNLEGINVPVFLEYYDWCLLETFYDHCSVEVVDVDGEHLGYLDPDTGGDYDWTQRVYDVTPFAGQAIKIRFRIMSDDTLQRDGWFIDEVRVTVAGDVPLPPVAEGQYVETEDDTPVNIVMLATDPNFGTALSFIVTELPLHGTLYDPAAGEIASAPYTLAMGGHVVNYVPDLGYQGPDQYVFRAFDGTLESNNAKVTLSVGTLRTAYEDDLAIDPGWLRDGAWAYGIPQGQDGDPTSGYTGLNVFGYNLAGEYANDMPPRYLTTLPFNCRGLSRVTLDFARWLGVESNSYDNASIEATNDGERWVTVWSHRGGDLQEAAWSLQSYNIHEVADDQPFVQIRWVMGPTDAGATFSGWNIDDVSIRAIGDPEANQPPLSKDIEVTTARNIPVDIDLPAVDQEGMPMDFTILSYPENGQLYDPSGGLIDTLPYTLEGGGNVVQYVPDNDFFDVDAFRFSVSDGSLESNVAKATIIVLDPAPFPYEEDFESGPPLNTHFSAMSGGPGRIRVVAQNEPIGTYHLTMDSGSEGSYSLNELELVINLEGQSGVLLYYDWKDFGEESHPLPDSWTGSVEGDGVAISEDGETWYRIADLFDPALASAGDDETGAPRASFYQNVLIDLDLAAANAGITYKNTFRIKFQQYDNYPIDTDGIALDNIRVVQGTEFPTIVSSVLPAATLGEPYGPQQVQTIGGDLPLNWYLPVIFSEENLGDQAFDTNGVAQGWQSDNGVFDYVLPFPFPFYNEEHTAIKVAADGWINFGTFVGSTWNNSEVLLAFNKRVTALWDDLRTDMGGDIYIDESVPRQVTIRWDAVTKFGGQPCNFAVTLFDDGSVRFDYGAGNTGLTPTIGLSSGDGGRYFLASHDGAASLDEADSLALDYGKLPPGLSMDATGKVSGVPTDLGSFQPIFRIEDQRGRTDTRTIPIAVMSSLFGDYDGDGDVDLDDLGWFTFCLDEFEPTPQCISAFDVDGDRQINLVDFAEFQRVFTD